MEVLSKIWNGVKKGVCLVFVTIAVVIGDLCMAIIRRSKIVNEIAKKISAESLRSEQ